MRDPILFIKLLLCSFCLYCNASFAQEGLCGFDYSKQAQQAMNPHLKLQEEEMNGILYEDAVNAFPSFESAQTVYQIPVVVHIMHENGPENISDATVAVAIDQLNLRFQNAAPYDDSTGHAVNIQFCLASIDPQGNPTNGIARHTSAGVVYDQVMKDISRWDPLYYYNIWTVKTINSFPFSVSGFSSLPSNAGDNTDGVVVLYWALNNMVLTHESGHFMGLYHTFGSQDCTNLNCLLDGDHVCDTPPDTSTSGCMGNSCTTDLEDTTGFSPFMIDEDELPNYMDYASCRISFSQGQADRMESSLVNIRSTLLQSIGCGFPGGVSPVAHMSILNPSTCDNGTVYFSDSLSTDSQTANWDFDNNGVYDSYSHSTSYTFPATGYYTVRLFVTGPGGIDSAFQTIFVRKASTPYYPIVSMNGIFTNIHGQLQTCRDFTNYFTSAPAQSYLWSTGDTTQSISFLPDTVYTLTLTIVDSMGLTWTNELCRPLTVISYPLPPTPVIYTNDETNICNGDTVTFHSTVNGNGSYFYQWYQNGFEVGPHDSVFTVTGFFTNIQYRLIIHDSTGCHRYSNVITVNSFSPPSAQSLTQNNYQLISGFGQGNQWYMNGDSIPGATGTTYNVTQPGCYSVGWFFSSVPQCFTMSDTICFTTVDVSELHVNSGEFLIYPIPSHSVIRIKTLLKSEFSILEPLGRVVFKGRIEAGTSELDLSLLANGIYFLEMFVDEKKIIRKIIKE